MAPNASVKIIDKEGEPLSVRPIGSKFLYPSPADIIPAETYFIHAENPNHALLAFRIDAQKNISVCPPEKYYDDSAFKPADPLAYPQILLMQTDNLE